jgi:hypothetical protein
VDEWTTYPWIEGDELELLVLRSQGGCIGITYPLTEKDKLEPNILGNKGMNWRKISLGIMG